MSKEIIYAQNPETLEINAYQVDVAQLAASAGGGHDPNFRWAEDEAWDFVSSKGVPSESVEIPHHIYKRFGVRDPRISYTYSAAGAARALGISRRAFLDRLENHPLVARGVHDGRPVYRWDDLAEWDAGIPKPGRPKNS